MRIIVFFVIILIAAGYIGSQITQVKNQNVIIYFTWAFGLILLNVLIGFFLYAFRHSILNTSGQPGLKGKMGRRGEEGTRWKQESAMEWCVGIQGDQNCVKLRNDLRHG